MSQFRGDQQHHAAIRENESRAPRQRQVLPFINQTGVRPLVFYSIVYT